MVDVAVAQFAAGSDEGHNLTLIARSAPEPGTVAAPLRCGGTQ